MIFYIFKNWKLLFFQLPSKTSYQFAIGFYLFILLLDFSKDKCYCLSPCYNRQKAEKWSHLCYHGSFSTFPKLIAPCSFHSNSVFCNCFYESIGSLYYCSTKIQIFIMYLDSFVFLESSLLLYCFVPTDYTNILAIKFFRKLKILVCV